MGHCHLHIQQWNLSQVHTCQCELWTDNNDMGEENIISFRGKSTPYAVSNYAEPMMIAESEAIYET